MPFFSKSSRGEGAARIAIGLGGGALLLVSVWGFSVDDAWIVARVAARGASGDGFSFNPGETTDAVTPLGFAHLVGGAARLLGWTSQERVFAMARACGVLGTLVALAGVVHFAPRGRARKLVWIWLPLLPLSIWAGAGLATGCVAALLTWGALPLLRGELSPGATLLLGAAAAWRPELCFFSGCLVIWNIAFVLRHGARPASRRAALSCALGWLFPGVLVAGIRWGVFGRFFPLSAVAKEPSLASGWYYALVTLLWFSAGWLFLASDLGRKRGFAAAYVAHLVGLVLVGGDWMPALRLSAPLAPLALAVRADDDSRGFLPRLVDGATWVPALLLLWQQGSDLRAVVTRRTTLIEEVAPLLVDAKRVAAVDVGWVGFAHAGPVLDLAGVTDPRIARLPGGHTSKKVAPGLFSDRDVDAWIVRDRERSFVPGAELERIVPAYVVDARLLRRFDDLAMRASATVPLKGDPGQYVVFRSLDSVVHSGELPRTLTGGTGSGR